MKARLIAAALLLSSSSMAFAGDIYVAGSVGRSSMNIDQGGTDAELNSIMSPIGRVTSSSVDKNGTALKLQLGYQFNPNWAVEGGYVDLGKASHKAKTNLGDINTEIKTTAWNIAAVGIAPLNDKFSVFGKIGAYRGKAEATVSVAGFSAIGDSSATRAVYGIGVMYDVSKAFGIRAEYEHFNDWGNLLSAGVLAKF